MALIRQSPGLTPAKDAVVLDLGDLSRSASRVLDAARDQASAIIQQARAQRAALLKNAAAEGHAQGLEEGRREGTAQGIAAGKKQAMDERRSQLDTLESAWCKALESFQAQRQKMLTEARQDVLVLALMVAEAVTKRKIEIDPSVVAAQVEGVLGILSGPTRLRVSVHPDDEPLIREALPTLAQRFPDAKDIQLAADPALARGSCIARSAGGEIDASIPTQIRRIAETLVPGRDLGALSSEKAA